MAPRKLAVNDIITITVDLQEGYLEISVNNGEFSHKFLNTPSSPLSGDPSGYWFGATFGTCLLNLNVNLNTIILLLSCFPLQTAANDHRLKITPEPVSVSPVVDGQTKPKTGNVGL